MADEIYYKLPGSILKDIAEALREQKGTLRQYAPEEFASVIRSFYTIPAASAHSEIMLNYNMLNDSSATGFIPICIVAEAISELRHIGVLTSEAGPKIIEGE